ncbi:hypothetical protein ABVK25_000154 [Lepraria finkii]|uniref:DNA-(apurinic or apyrimidinic site) lyase n=1 Tax=Lepraria finkii TaxID=1340010 RepID=A0ABR4BNC3_9LECA
MHALSCFAIHSKSASLAFEYLPLDNCTMAAIRALEWRKIPVNLAELCLDTTLRCGQSFRWKKSEDDIWSCALHGRILSLRQDSTHLHYKAIMLPHSHQMPMTPPSSTPHSTVDSEDDDTKDLVQHYLNLGTNLTELYEQWSTADANFKKKAPKFIGIRILQQDAWEALVGFICSSNNNIIRISQMMEKLCLHYGSLIGEIDSRQYYDMPPASALTAPGVEAHLRQLGFGYRAKYLHQTALMISEDHEDGWLDTLRNPESPIMGMKPFDAGEIRPGGREGYRRAHGELLALQGVGPKVADCICLMGLGWGEAVPVDTHVWQIAQRDYKFGKGKHSSLTRATYNAVGDKVRSLWGLEAGWAHTVLFTADLRAFAERLSTKIEIKEVKQEDDATVLTETNIKAELLRPISMKREFDEEKGSPIAFEKVTTKREVKRRRRT